MRFRNERDAFRFWSRVQPTVSGCWQWTGATNRFGYGNFKFDRTNVNCHRVSFAQCVGDAPRGTVVMHSCDNPGCVNPLHLSAGAQRVNVADGYRRGRHFPCRGERHGFALVTEQEVRDIRASNLPRAALAAYYGIKPRTVRAIRERQTWRHVTNA